MVLTTLSVSVSTTYTEFAWLPVSIYHLPQTVAGRQQRKTNALITRREKDFCRSLLIFITPPFD
jgi:hypothetical protein